MTEPTAGAMRAADIVLEEYGMSFLRERTTRVAAMIDRETGLPELIAACERLIREGNSDAWDQAQRAIVRAKGEPNAPTPT